MVLGSIKSTDQCNDVWGNDDPVTWSRQARRASVQLPRRLDCFGLQRPSAKATLTKKSNLKETKSMYDFMREADEDVQELSELIKQSVKLQMIRQQSHSLPCLTEAQSSSHDLTKAQNLMEVLHASDPGIISIAASEICKTDQDTGNVNDTVDAKEKEKIEASTLAQITANDANDSVMNKKL